MAPRLPGRAGSMSVTLRYWAGLKAAAGMAQEQVEAGVLDAALAQARARHDNRFTEVLACCSLIVDGDPVGSRDHARVELVDGSLVDCLPPFAGG